MDSLLFIRLSIILGLIGASRVVIFFAGHCAAAMLSQFLLNLEPQKAKSTRENDRSHDQMKMTSGFPGL